MALPTTAPDLAELARRIQPVTLAREQTLPVAAPLRDLLPWGGLQRGATVAVTGAGARSLLLALVGEATATGSWVAAVGLDDLGLVAAHELGVRLERLVVVDRPEPAAWAGVVAALVGAFDVVLVAPGRVRAADARRLSARLRERGTVTVQLGDDGLDADVRLDVRPAAWDGLGDGHGTLRACRVAVRVDGRRRSARRRDVELWLPGPDGTIATVADRPSAPISPESSASPCSPSGPTRRSHLTSVA